MEIGRCHYTQKTDGSPRLSLPSWLSPFTCTDTHPETPPGTSRLPPLHTYPRLRNRSSCHCIPPMAADLLLIYPNGELCQEVHTCPDRLAGFKVPHVLTALLHPAPHLGVSYLHIRLREPYCHLAGSLIKSIISTDPPGLNAYRRAPGHNTAVKMPRISHGVIQGRPPSIWRQILRLHGLQELQLRRSPDPAGRTSHPLA